ncbi:Mur ligase family protein, partial [Alphaproteobacteria bacterium]|nr:Mur ligase family protein [Alphaproteobacteria bacterium]
MQKILISKIVNIIIEKNPRFVFDSRNIKNGDIFIGIKTKNDDGSNYIDSALQKGCLLAIINSKHSNKKVIYTMNVTKFIKLIAYEVLNKYKGKVIAITGSVGKTTMKENISNYLFSKNITHFKSYKNFNNELGLIFNILNIKFNTTYSIFELGISKINEMKKLTNILNPHYVLI